MDIKKSESKIMPAGPLMKEHRTIDAMIVLFKKEEENLETNLDLDTFFITQAADFIKTYVDQCHHGKEENILFRELSKKEISKEHFEIMSQLIEEHKYGRKLLSELMESADRYEKKDIKAKREVLNCLKALTELYSRHIEKEDKVFFPASRGYLTEEEEQEMLEKFREFDSRMIHEKYKAAVKQLEG